MTSAASGTAARMIARSSRTLGCASARCAAMDASTVPYVAMPAIVAQPGQSAAVGPESYNPSVEGL
jgi:hypothetical protein